MEVDRALKLVLLISTVVSTSSLFTTPSVCIKAMLEHTTRVGDMYRARGTLNRNGYHSILQRHAIPSCMCLVGQVFILHQDNATETQVQVPELPQGEKNKMVSLKRVTRTISRLKTHLSSLWGAGLKSQSNRHGKKLSEEYLTSIVEEKIFSPIAY